LTKLAKADCKKVLASIFVNPAQFAPNEDFSKYPRTLEHDIELLTAAGVDAVFTPDVETMYPSGYFIDKGSFVEVKGKSEMLEGTVRPHFFRGVATVVTKLLNIAQASHAYFGQKDAQQCVVVGSMVRDLHIPTKIVIAPILRESHGLAMSSRNVYLTPEQRQKSGTFYKALKAAQDFYDKSSRDKITKEEIIEVVRNILKSEPLFVIQYIEVTSTTDLKVLDIIDKKDKSASILISAAVQVANTRLIDNIILGNTTKHPFLTFKTFPPNI